MKILLAVDGSEHAEGAAQFVTRFNLSTEDEITVLHIINFFPLLNGLKSYEKTVLHIKQDIAPKILDRAVDILQRTKAKRSTAIVEGPVEQSIINAGVDADVDMIVIGARGQKGFSSLIVGSVTRTVALNAPVPVLVIKPAQWEDSGRLKILFATDGSEYADATGRFLATVPFSKSSELTIVNVVKAVLREFPERYFIEIDDRTKEKLAKTRSVELAEAEKIIERTKRNLKERFSPIDGLTKIGDPSVGIIEAAETLKSDIIVVGCRGLKGIKGMMGSVSRNIIRHAQCSFLIGKAC